MKKFLGTLLVLAGLFQAGHQQGIDSIEGKYNYCTNNIMSKVHNNNTPRFYQRARR